MKHVCIGLAFTAAIAAQDTRRLEVVLPPDTKATQFQVRFYEADVFPTRLQSTDLVFVDFRSF